MSRSRELRSDQQRISSWWMGQCTYSSGDNGGEKRVTVKGKIDELQQSSFAECSVTAENPYRHAATMAATRIIEHERR